MQHIVRLLPAVNGRVSGAEVFDDSDRIPEDPQSVGRRIRFLRVVLGPKLGLPEYTIRELGDLVGRDEAAFGAYERGAALQIDVACRLADLYGVTLDWIYRRRMDEPGLTVRHIIASAEAELRASGKDFFRSPVGRPPSK